MIWTKKAILQRLKNKDTWVFEIKQKKSEVARSQLQVRYYWGVVVKIISDYHWYSPIETNEMLKITFWKTTFTDLSSKEFMEIINIIRDLWKNKYNVIIPLPQDTLEYRSLCASFF